MTHPILARRLAEREGLLGRARDYVAGIQTNPRVRAAVVFGSVARGDFNVWSDIDLLILADAWPEGWQDRIDALPPRPAQVQPIAWTVEEWRNQLARGNPIALETSECGVVLFGALPDPVP